MQTSAKCAFGTKLSFGDADGGPYATDVAEVRDYSTPEIASELLDVTPHPTDGSATGFAQYIASAVTDPPEITFTSNFIHDDPSHEHTATGLLYLALNKIKKHYQVTLPTASGNLNWQFAGLVTRAKVNTPVKGELTLEVTIKPTDYMRIV